MRRQVQRFAELRDVVACSLLALLLTAGVERDAATLNRDGTKAFEQGRYDDASRLYSEALMRAPESESISYNLGTALYKTSRFEDAASAFARASRAEDPGLRLKSFYNLGNTLFRMGNLAKAVEAYKRALDVDPTDFDTKVSLEKAIKLLEEQEQEQQEQQEPQQSEESQQGQEGQEGTSGGDQQRQQEGNEQQSEEGDQNQQGEQDGEPSSAEGEEQPSDPQQQQPGAEDVREGDLRYEEALRILDAMRDQEKEQQKAKAQKLRARAKRSGKDW